MRKESIVQNVIIVVLAVAVIAMSVGYATLSRTLNVEGTATFTKAKWDVHFDAGTFQETTDIKASEKSIGDTDITYTVTLPKPGSKYTFKVDAKNFGTIDAKMQKITITGLDTTKKFISTKFVYNGREYTETTDGLAEALAADASHTLEVTLEYVLPSNEADLPTTADVTINPTVSLYYVDNTN